MAVFHFKLYRSFKDCNYILCKIQYNSIQMMKVVVLVCAEPFSNSRPGEKWVRCMVCRLWSHEEYTNGDRNIYATIVNQMTKMCLVDSQIHDSCVPYFSVTDAVYTGQCFLTEICSDTQLM